MKVFSQTIKSMYVIIIRSCETKIHLCGWFDIHYLQDKIQSSFLLVYQYQFIDQLLQISWAREGGGCLFLLIFRQGCTHFYVFSLSRHDFGDKFYTEDTAYSHKCYVYFLFTLYIYDLSIPYILLYQLLFISLHTRCYLRLNPATEQKNKGVAT